MQNEEDQLFLWKDSGFKKLFQSDTIKHNVGDLITVNQEELDQDNSESVGTDIESKEALKFETLLEGFDLIDESIKSEETDVKSEEEDVPNTTLSSGIIQKGYEESKNNVYDPYLYGTTEEIYSSELLPHKSAKKETVNKCKRSKSTTRRTFPCDQCEFRTTWKNVLKRHVVLIHKNREGVNWFRCHHCDYQTHRKCAIKMHLLTHKDPEELVQFQCNFCDYRSIHKLYLNKHLVTHKDPAELKWFQCDYCNFRTSRKRGMNKHVLKHQNPETLSCDHCDYKSLRKDDLKTHMVTYHNREEDLFRCGQCDYRTFKKRCFTLHLLKHKCLKNANLKHISKQKNLKEIVWFRCDYCDYKTVRNRDLTRHTSKCKSRRGHLITNCGRPEQMGP